MPVLDTGIHDYSTFGTPETWMAGPEPGHDDNGFEFALAVVAPPALGATA